MNELQLTEDRKAILGIALRNLRESLRQDPSEMPEDLAVLLPYIDLCSEMLIEIDEDEESTFE